MLLRAGGEFLPGGGDAANRDSIAWQPTGTPVPNFHVSEVFGKLIFADGATTK